MKRTLFVFGRTPELAFEELRTFFPSASRIAPFVAAVSDEVDAAQWIKRLGGTVKIAVEAGENTTLSQEQIVEIIAAKNDKHVTFGISVYGTHAPGPGWYREVKERLDQVGIAARYVEAKHDDQLSSIVIARQEVREIIAVAIEGGILLGETVAVQEFEEWNDRDRLRPGYDAKRGMLPPKVARMIVNIVTPNIPGKTPTLLDPFCGVGTVLSEAALVGYAVVGCDIMESSVEKAKKNLHWLEARYPEIETRYKKVFVGDATHISEELGANSVDAIATEPFLGDTRMGEKGEPLDPANVKNTIKGLEKLYIGSLREWHKSLVTGAKVAIAIPAYVTTRGMVSVKNVIDRFASLGYTLLTGPIEYSRPQAIVRREFYILQKTN
jgi:tRNA G10  N-methylase Trm11